MSSFVNREAELELVDDALRALLDKNRLLHTPILDFFGIDGIGKTTILREVMQRCQQNNIPFIWADARKNLSDFPLSIINQVKAKGYRAPLLEHSEKKELLDQSVDAARALLADGPLVMLLDSVDATNEEQSDYIEEMLHSLVDNNRLFVVVASRKDIAFNKERTIARRLTTHALKPFNRESSDLYLQSLDEPIELELRDLIFDWTRGYPLAMDAMAKAILEQKYDPRKKKQRRDLLKVIMERVIDHGILARIEDKERAWFLTMLRLLSVPRRFNLVILQDLIEKFEPDLKEDGSLSYIALPRRINQATDVLSWNLDKAGFSIAVPIRHLFLLQQSMENTQRYHETHRFLAELNTHYAKEVSGTDRIRYQLEYLYHSASSVDSQQLPQILSATIQQITSDVTKSPDPLIQFLEEFRLDEELKELLGTNVSIVLSLIYKHLAYLFRQSAQEVSGASRIHRLRGFYDAIRDAELRELSSALVDYIDNLIQGESPDIVLQFYEELAEENKFREALGETFTPLFRRIRDNASLEG